MAVEQYEYTVVAIDALFLLTRAAATACLSAVVACCCRWSVVALLSRCLRCGGCCRSLARAADRRHDCEYV